MDAGEALTTTPLTVGTARGHALSSCTHPLALHDHHHDCRKGAHAGPRLPVPSPTTMGGSQALHGQRGPKKKRNNTLSIETMPTHSFPPPPTHTIVTQIDSMAPKKGSKRAGKPRTTLLARGVNSLSHAAVRTVWMEAFMPGSMIRDSPHPHPPLHLPTTDGQEGWPL